MFASRALPLDTAETGFAVSNGKLLSLSLGRRIDEMLVFYVVAVALLAAIVIPAWQASQVTPVFERKIEQTVNLASKGDRLRKPDVDNACSGVTYGNETSECLVAIARDSGRERAVGVRIVTFDQAGNG
jgi:hypothetical protein